MKFEARMLRLLAEWEELEEELKRLSKLVGSHTLKPNKAGSMVAHLICRTAFITASLAFDPDETFSAHAEKGLLCFSTKKFNSFLDEVMAFGKQHPRITSGFEKTSSKILKTVRRPLEKNEGNVTD